jgi:hypothetical protein
VKGLSDDSDSKINREKKSEEEPAPENFSGAQHFVECVLNVESPSRPAGGGPVTLVELLHNAHITGRC